MQGKEELLYIVYPFKPKVWAIGFYLCSGGGMVDTGDLKSPGRNPVRVRLPPRANILF